MDIHLKKSNNLNFHLPFPVIAAGVYFVVILRDNEFIGRSTFIK